MKCIYCGAVIEDDTLRCPICHRNVQLVPDYNIMDDEYFRQLMAEETQKQQDAAERDEAEDDVLLYGPNAEEVQKMSRQTQQDAKEKKSANATSSDPKKKKKKNRQRSHLVTVSVVVIVLVLILIAGVVLLAIYQNQSASADYQLKQAQEAAERGDIDRAISYYKKAAELQPKNVDIRVSLGNLYLETEDYESAIFVFSEAAELSGRKSIEAYSGLLSAYDALDMYDEISAVGAQISDITVLAALSQWLVDAPVFNYESGTYTEAIQVTLTAAKDCTIFYTTDSTDPIAYGKKYATPISFSKDGTYYIYAVCVNQNGVCSVTLKNEYIIELAAPDSPAVYPQGGTFSSATQITVDVPVGCSAYYTWDETDPDASANRYVGPISMPVGSNVLKVVIIDDASGKTSSVYSALYIYYE